MSEPGEFRAPRATVPASFVGLWRRDFLEWSGGEDTTTRVFWMQTDSLYIDLRVPGGRPDFARVGCLADCDDPQLHWLAGQQGFAGWLEVSGARFQWHRTLDLQPDRAVQDIGLMRVMDGYVLEEGVFSDYREHWVQITPEIPPRSAYRLQQVLGGAGGAKAWRGYFLTLGDRFMLALDRRSRLPQGPSLHALCQYDRTCLLDSLDMEISLGRVDPSGQAGHIELSTHPFREGAWLGLPAAFSEGSNLAVQAVGSLRLHWLRV